MSGKRTAIIATRTCLSIIALLAVASTGCTDPIEPGEIEAVDGGESEANEPIEARPAVDPEPGTDSDDHFIDADEAADLALFVGISKTVEVVEPIADEFGDDVFHIINYAEGGFVIIAADDRVTPLLAYDDSGSFGLDAEVYPEGLVGWLIDQKETVQTVRASGESTAAVALEPCDMVGLVHGEQPDGIQAPGQTQAACPGEPPLPCSNQYNYVAPLVATTWGQTDGYNDALNYMGCNNDDGRPPTGCVATAMAQIMRYHQHPPSYNWGSMANNYGNWSTAVLMRNAGLAVDMDYGCSGSGAETSDVPSALKNQFGYSSANYASFSWSTVRSELDAGKPVILRGGERGGFWPFYYYTDGHAWVSDGYSRTYYCETGSTYTYLHMNWGWNGGYDGWYSVNNWNPAGDTYNYQRGMVYNIRP